MIAKVYCSFLGKIERLGRIVGATVSMRLNATKSVEFRQRQYRLDWLFLERYSYEELEPTWRKQVARSLGFKCLKKTLITIDA